MGETIKQRDYMFDTFRGSADVVNSDIAFYKGGRNFLQDSLGGVIYITINVFVMQAFVFLSGYFSKKPDRVEGDFIPHIYVAVSSRNPVFLFGQTV